MSEDTPTGETPKPAQRINAVPISDIFTDGGCVHLRATEWQVREKLVNGFTRIVRRIPFHGLHQYDNLLATLEPGEELSLVYA